MSTTLSMWLGIAFVLLAIVAVVLQAWLWSFPMEPDPGGPDPNGKSTAPRSWTNVHRLVGFAYVVIYIVLMWEMVPRLWEYQFELPARTVIHAVMGIVIGVLLIAKIAIIRWFQHFGKSLPTIGFLLLLCTLILATLSLPFAIQAHGLDSRVFSESNIARVERILEGIDFGAEVDTKELAQKDSLADGRRVLTHKCVTCHDLRTILVKPRTGTRWHSVVMRMAEKPVIGEPFTDEENRQVTAYLVAITPDIQSSTRERRAQDRKVQEEAQKVSDALAKVGDESANEQAFDEQAFDEQAAEELYEDQCTQCHELDIIEEYGGHNAQEWAKAVARMVDEEGAELTPEQADIIVQYLARKYPK